MKTLITTIIATLVMGLTVNAGTKVRMDYDPNASFDHLRTYSWAEHVESNDVDHALSGPLVSDRIREAIDTELANLGYEKVDPGEADFLVDYQLSTEEKTEVTTFGGFYGNGGYGRHISGYRSGHGYGHNYGHRYGYGYSAYPRYNGYGYGHHSYNPYYGNGYGYGATQTVREVLEVTLTLNIIDTQTSAVIWSGWAIKSLKQNPTPKKIRKFITKSVHKTLKEFPPEDLAV